MIRLASNDLTRWTMEDNPCGRTYPRLPEGVYGRIDDMITIRGENVYPIEVDNFLRGLAGYGGEHQIIVTRAGSMDEMTVRAECTYPDRERAEFTRAGRDGLQTVLGVRVTFEAVDANTIERAEHKSRRVTDQRGIARSHQEV
jgi:phenylacetate-CoA ligase